MNFLLEHIETKMSINRLPSGAIKISTVVFRFGEDRCRQREAVLAVRYVQRRDRWVMRNLMNRKVKVSDDR